MAHGGGGGGFGENLAPKIGLLSSAAILILVAGAGWVIFTAPRVALRCGGWAFALGGLCSNPVAHPLYGLLAIVVGLCCAGGSKPTKVTVQEANNRARKRRKARP